MLLATGLLAALTVTGCSTGSEGGSSSSDSAASAGGTDDSAAKEAAKTAPDSDTVVAARSAADRKLARSAQLQVKVGSIPKAAAEIRGIALAQDGAVVSEELYSGPDTAGDDVRSTLTISVPASSLEATIDRVSRVGEVQVRTSSARDVTDTYVDTEARVASLTASVARIRALMADATNVRDLVSIEEELSRRQSDLDALKAQLASLTQSVAMSPVTVTLSTDDVAPVGASGFLSGLRAGWSAFLASLAVLVTAVGAVLPFAVAAAVVAVPLVWWLRRRRPLARRQRPEPPTAASAG